MSFAETLKQIRKERGLTQENLTEIMEVSSQAVIKGILYFKKNRKRIKKYLTNNLFSAILLSVVSNNAMRRGVRAV